MVVLSLLVAWPGLAFGQKPDIEAAKKHFKSGQALMQMERWGAAIEEFKKAYDITKDGLVMGQVGQAYEKAGDYEGAKQAYTRYRDALSPGDRRPANALIKKCEKMIKEGRTKKLVLPSEEAAAAKNVVKPPPGEEGEGAPKPEPVDEEGGRSYRLYTWIAAGAAGALALSALIVGLNAQSRFDELSDTCKPACSDSEVDSVKTRALVTDVLWGAAAAAAVTAAVLYFVEGRSLKSSPESPGKKYYEEEEEEEEDFVHRLQISPVMGQGTYGLGARLSF
jgi:tetratricopeptide (TPR) repeat protein